MYLISYIIIPTEGVAFNENNFTFDKMMSEECQKKFFEMYFKSRNNLMPGFVEITQELLEKTFEQCILMRVVSFDHYIL